MQNRLYLPNVAHLLDIKFKINEKNGLHGSTFIAIRLDKIVGYLHILAIFVYLLTTKTC